MLKNLKEKKEKENKTEAIENTLTGSKLGELLCSDLLQEWIT
jgi:hypothetical protein